MIIPSDPDLYGEWDLSPFGFRSHFGQICLSESKFELLVFLTGNADFFVGYDLVGKRAGELKGVCSGKLFFLIHPKIIASETYNDGTVLLKIRFSRFLRKIHLDYLEEPFISDFSIVFEDIWDWKDGRIDTRTINEIGFNSNILFVIDLKKIKVQFKEVTLTSFSENKHLLEKKFQIDVSFKEKKGTLKDLEYNIECVISLLVLITGIHLNPEKIYLFYREGKDVEIVEYFDYCYNELANSYVKISGFLFYWDEIKEQIERIFMNFYDNLGINRYFLVNASRYVNKKILQGHEEYLNLTRIVEGTHRSNVPQGKFALRERLIQICNELLPSGLIETIEDKYNDKIENIIKKWCLMRNMLTHLDGDKHEAYSSHDIRHGVFDMRMLLHVYLLFVLGVDLKKSRNKFVRYFL